MIWRDTLTQHVTVRTSSRKKKEKGGKGKTERKAIITIVVAIVVLSLFVATGNSVMEYNQTPTPTPTLTQKEIFDAILARLVGNAASMPIPVNDVISSLTGHVGFSFICPSGCPVFACTLDITTTVKDWDPKEAEEVEEETGKTPVGIYSWSGSWQVVGDIKTITAENWVMLDPAVTTDAEADPPMGTLANEGLLYHELLHGQLLINTMKTSLTWQESACHCNIDLDPTGDLYHSQIYPAEDAYLDARAAGMANVKVVEPDPKKAEKDGTFNVNLGPTNKKSVPVSPSIIAPTGGGNVKNVIARVIEGHLWIRGELVKDEKGKFLNGKFLVRIDPEDEWIFGGLENAIVVLSPSAVGGIWVPVDKFGLLAPYIALASTILVVTAATTIYGKRRNKKQ